ncbi:MAG: M48 family metallopeptidase [Nitrososphaerota archaeon]|nr:M48 family metallopeptidase [Candidatus Bathyarchaeota archaeon]MDW8048936.1 M48 family metallopeptidase [Nitrososphaerota archaeon]
MSRLSFYDEIARNKRSSILLALTVSAFIFALIYLLVYILSPALLIYTIPISIVLISVYASMSYKYGDSLVLASVNAKPADANKFQYLRDTVEGLSIAAGIPTPKVYIIESKEMNALATGRGPRDASIAVTTGLLGELNRLELEGVIGHEIAHIRNRDVLFMTYVAVLVGLAAILSHMILRSFRMGRLRRIRGGREPGWIEAIVIIAGLILAAIAPLVTRLVQFAISRRREFLADASSAELTRYPEGLASALEKIMNKNKGRMDVSEAVSHLFFVDPNHNPMDRLFATHPPVEERIRRLRAM